MSCDYQDFEYVFGDCSDLCDEESRHPRDELCNSPNFLKSSLENAASSDARLQLIRKYFVPYVTPMEPAIDAFIDEIQQRTICTAKDEEVQLTLKRILNFMTVKQIQSVFDNCVIDVNDPALLISALNHFDSEGSYTPNLELLDLLLERGSDPNAVLYDNSPLEWLIRNFPQDNTGNCVKAVKSLLSHGARFKKPGNALDPFREAALRGRQDIFRVFLDLNEGSRAAREASNLLWAVSLADMRNSESVSSFENLLRARESFRSSEKTVSRKNGTGSGEDLIESQALQQLRAGLDTVIEFFRSIEMPSPGETAMTQLVVTKFARAADIRLTSGSEYATLAYKPLSLGFEFPCFKTPKRADFSFKEFANLVLNLSRSTLFHESTLQALLSELLRCTTHQDNIMSQLDELSHPDELGAVLCAVSASLRERQRNELWTPQDSKYEERLIYSLLRRGAYVRHVGFDGRPPIDLLTNRNLPLKIRQRVEIANCCVYNDESEIRARSVPPLRCQVAKYIAKKHIKLNDDETHYRIFIGRASVASLGEFVRAHDNTIKPSGT